MSATQTCPECGNEIPVGSPAGLCPTCLLKVGLASRSAVNAQLPPTEASPQAPTSGFVPPTPAELGARFPQLEILELLGHGGMGAVYKARQPGLDRLVAVKILPPELGQDSMFIERFTREARALAKLSHPNIVAVYDFGQTPIGQAFQPDSQAGKPDLREMRGYCYFVMEYVDGVNLRQAMRAGQLKSAEALKIVPQICDALQFAHDEGIVHRDIKPENILLDKKGRVKIADFGLAKLFGKTAPDVALTGTQEVMGTLHYMAPEQFKGLRDVDHRADIYSLGVTFYEMLTGELPIGRFAPPSQKVQIDVRLDEVVLRSLEKEPEQRYQHASDIKTEMDTIARVSLPSQEPRPPAVFAPASANYLRGVIIPIAACSAAFVLVMFANLGLSFVVPERVGRFLLQEGGAFLLFGGGFLLVAGFLVLNGVWIARKLAYMSATAKRPWLVPILGALNMLVAVTSLFCIASGVIFPNEIPEAIDAVEWQRQLYHVWWIGDAACNYLASIAWFAGGLGLLMWKPWARRLTVATAVFLIALIILEIPAIIAFGIQPLVTQLQAHEFGGLGPEEFLVLAIIGIVIAAGFVVGKLYHIAVLVYLMRPRIVAAFDQGDEPLPVGPAETIRRFRTSDSTLTQDGITVADDAWIVDAMGAQTIRFFEIADPQAEQCQITYRAKIKTEGLAGRAFLEMWCRLPGRGEFFSKGLHQTVQSTTDWATYEIPFVLKTGERPDLIKLNLVVEGKGKVWIKDIELLRTPLASRP